MLVLTVARASLAESPSTHHTFRPAAAVGVPTPQRLRNRIEAWEAAARQDDRSSTENQSNKPLRRLPPVSARPVGLTSQTQHAAPSGDTKWAAIDFSSDPKSVSPAFFFQPAVDDTALGMLDAERFAPSAQTDFATFRGDFANERSGNGIGIDLYSTPDFEGGLVVRGERVAMKFGGFTKADFIYDFDAIDATDSFDTTTIGVRVPNRKNSRFHARSSRLSFDTRWASDTETVRVFVEGDFFSDGDRYRLRHAYGEVGSLLVGKTWTTFHQTGASPNTLDFEGSVSSVNRRQAQARWTRTLFHENVTFAASVEDARFIVEEPDALPGDARSPSPDFVIRLRLDPDWGQFQFAYLYRIGGFQPTGGRVGTGNGWGFNFSGVALLTERAEAYYQLVFGDGIGSYRGLPDAAPTAADALGVLSTFAWMVGFTTNWTESLSSNFTYAENSVDNTPLQAPDDVQRTTYLAANLIWSPLNRVDVGIEYLYGILENVAGDAGKANRVQTSFIFYLP